MKRPFVFAKRLSLLLAIISLLSLSSLFASSIAGQITGNDNLPLQGAQVNLMNVPDNPDSVMNAINNLLGRHGGGGGHDGDGEGNDHTFITTMTNMQGNYSFNNVALGSYIVCAQKNGYQPQVYVNNQDSLFTIIQVSSENQEIVDINIMLNGNTTPPNPFGPGIVSGQLINSQNQGNHHSQIGLVSVQDPNTLINHFITMAGFNGEYQIHNIPVSEIAYKTVAINNQNHQILAYSPEFFITQEDFIVEDINITVNTGNDSTIVNHYAVSGSLISDDAQQINHRHLVLFAIDSDNNSFPHFMVRHTVSNEAGAFTFNNVQSGSYKIMVHSGFGMPVYYPGTTDLEEAGIITVDSANVENANITFNTQTTFTLAGLVKAANTETPLANITVTVDLFGNHHPNADSTFESISTLTDSTGHYSLVVPFGFYTLAAYSNDNTYQTQYYDHTQNPFRARIIRTFQDYADLDFDLLPANATASYSISGTVAYNDSIPPVPVMVVAVSSDQNWQEVAVTDEFGAYTLPIYNTGNYYIIACSHLAPPTYYVNSLTWEGAQLVPVEANVTGINFSLTGTGVTGPHCLNGTIVSAQGNAVPNVTIALNDANGNLISFARTNEDGAYSIMNLPAQNMQMLVTAMGYNTISENITIDGNEDINYTLSAPLADDNNTVQTAKFSINNYPNPFNPNTTISFTLVNDEKVSLDIYNIKGQKIKSFFNTQLVKGTHSVVWDGTDNMGKNVSSGIYFSKIKGEKTSSTHKMVLMK